MDRNYLKQLTNTYLEAFEKSNPENAAALRESLKKLDELGEISDLLTWWKDQSPHWIIALQSFVFWLWTGTNDQAMYELFEKVKAITEPVISRSWNMPIELTTGVDNPIFEGGFLNQRFSFAQYDFSPADRGFQVTCNDPDLSSDLTLDLFLDFLSFVLDKWGQGQIGFRQIASRKWKTRETTLIVGSFGPEMKTLPEVSFEIVESALSSLDLGKVDEELSLAALLHIRHRAVLDSNLESKLLNLWSFLEAQWAKEDKEDRLLTEEELDQTKQALKAFLPQSKYSSVINQISKLKSKTRNMQIIEGVRGLECTKGWDTNKIIRDIVELRGKLAHGGAISGDEETEQAKQYISFMLQVIQELIDRKLIENRINVG